MYDAIILAGGSSTRIGKNKALLSIEGESIIQRIIKVVKTLVDNIVIVLKERNDNTGILNLSSSERIQIIFEDYDFMSPLAGIYTGLTFSASDYSLVLPCDTPFLKREVIMYLFTLCEGYDLTIPRWPNGYLEPLCAVYNKKKLFNGVRQN